MKRRLNEGDIVVIEKAWSPLWEGLVAITYKIDPDDGVPWFEPLSTVVNGYDIFNLGDKWPKYMRVLGNVNGTAR